MTQSTRGLGWRVTSQMETTESDPNTGQFTTGYKVYFTTAGGHAGSVFVPRLNYSTAFVKPLITEMAARMDEVGNLTSDS